LIVWFFMQFFSGIGTLGIATAETGGVAYWAHIGGFISGFSLAGIYKLFHREPGEPDALTLPEEV
jgi:membrane associated rhomboid family serine protease